MTQNKKRFKLFDMNRDGPGVPKSDGPLKPTFANLPKFYFRHFTKVLSLNLLMLPLILIPLAALYFYVIADTTPSQMDTLYAPLYGSYLLTGNPAWTSLLGVYGLQLNLPVFDAGHIWLYIGLALLLAFVWGPVNIGATYICRSMVRGEPVFLWSDFWYAVRKNFKQGLLFGLLDVVCLAALTFDILYYMRVGGTFLTDFVFFAICFVIAVYLLMRFYIYLMIITFDMKLRKILKNALIFSILGFGRSLIAIFWTVVLVGLNVLLAIACYPIRFFVPVFLPILYLLPSALLIRTYSAYPTIQKYMIDPVPTPDRPDDDDDDDDDDDGDGGELSGLPV